MPCINYISNLAVSEFSGGWSGMNHHVYRQLKKCYDINLVDNVNPGYSLTGRILSKAYRAAHLRGEFPAFSPRRLNTIKEMVQTRLDSSASLNFYHGSTPWIHIYNTLPYSMYLDASFATYINVYHDASQFKSKQLSQLFNRESDFLSNARAVFFSSEWSLEDTKKHYHLDGSNFYVAGLGGGYENAEIGRSSIEDYFLFVGLDFKGKGGEKVLEAYKRVHAKFPHIKIKIVGQRPPSKHLYLKSIEYIGFIDKKTQERKLAKLFSEALGLLLPTTRDITPLVLIEAGSAGTPVVATNAFGIPEIVKHNITGILIDDDKFVTDRLAEAMLLLATDRQMGEQMGDNAIGHIKGNFTWNRTGSIICSTLAANGIR